MLPIAAKRAEALPCMKSREQGGSMQWQQPQIMASSRCESNSTRETFTQHACQAAMQQDHNHTKNQRKHGPVQMHSP